MKFKTVIFDLDGTLLNTLDDLADGVNYTLRYFGYAERTIDEVRAFVGNGVRNLIIRALPDDKKDLVDTVLPVFKEYYGAHSSVKTAPYKGILDLLKMLKEKGVSTAIVSNKYDLAVKELSKNTFKGLIDFALGEGNGIGIKPAPDGIYAAIKELNANLDDCVYVGDSEVDVLTAHNAGLPCISVTWGFRDEELLVSLGSEYVVHNTEELLNLILGE